MSKKPKQKEIIFYTLQAIDIEEKDFRIHVRADTEQGIKLLKRWLHKHLYRKLYYYDKVADYYTIKNNGKFVLSTMERYFQMVEGIPQEW